MDISGLVKRRVFWWVVGSLGATGIGIAILVMVLIFALLGALVSASDTSQLEGVEVPNNASFDIPMLLLPIYIQAENGQASWARLAAMHRVTTNFGAEKAKRIDTIGSLGFPRSLWETYRQDGDEDGEIDPDNPYDAIFSLANYLRASAEDEESALNGWFLNAEQVAMVHRKEAEYAAVLPIPGKWLWPLLGYTAISSPYGYRVDPVTGAPSEFHAGIDIPAPRGTPVMATQNGTVVQVVRSSTGYGNHILLQHANDFISLYGHLADIAVRQGQQVHQGEMIGWVGSTGKSTGPHLHFEMRVHGQTVDPLTLVFPPNEPPVSSSAIETAFVSSMGNRKVGWTLAGASGSFYME
ncbi:M23 family metallopeptidase [Cohnella fermenti]|uniref:Peptidase M23 n=1 Tax=Cohnella fermenti TaxID=2565925 RepID=A0A4S4BID4_9BACL|nr:M23 family metallopeptidase [Cohnella fermenti]THF74374.1 peptidase M23 [Cohnella fermenti]